MKHGALVVFSVSILMACSGLGWGQADPAACPLTLGMTVSTESRGDTVHVVALAVGVNRSGKPLDICGDFSFTAAFKPDSVESQEERSWPIFLVIDPEPLAPVLECEQVTLRPDDRISEEFTFSYTNAYFAGFPGKITIHAIFIYGSAGMSWNDAPRCDSEELKAALDVPAWKE
jgi:hypothetical protein